MMNNAQFRRLVQDTPKRDGTTPNTVRSLSGQTPVLGSRQRANIPMTPRALSGSSHGNDFARQLAERNAELNGTATKRFRSSAAPKGSKLGSGYTDRTQSRITEEDDDKSVRVKALEEQMKLGQLAPETFEALRDQIIGNDVSKVHLVKGLDYKLLERVRRGEDVLSQPTTKEKQPEKEPEKEVSEPEVDVDEEFEKLEGRDVQPLAREDRVKKGEMAVPPPPTAGKKRTRDDILKELRASRAKAAEEAKAMLPQLGPRFSKVGARKEMSKIEKDSKGREILITTDAEGNVKRKVKKAKVDDDTGTGLLMPDKDIAPLGMDVSAMAPANAPEPEDEDIFGEVGKDYNPLAGIMDDYDDDGDDDSDDSEAEAKPPLTANPDKSQPPSAASKDRDGSMAPPPKPVPAKRNYFNDTPSDDPTNATASDPLHDPTILAALKKASTINPLATNGDKDMDEEAAKLARRKKMLENNDRDADDMDLEFGSSRFGDQEDGEDTGKVKLAVWDGEGGDVGEGRKGGKKERKRAPKKRKGDVNSAADVLRVMAAKKKDS